MSRLSENLKLLRLLSGLSQTDLARRLKLSRNQINNYENDLSQPSIEVLYSISRLYGMSMDEIVGTELKTRALKAHFSLKKIQENG